MKINRLTNKLQLKNKKIIKFLTVFKINRKQFMKKDRINIYKNKKNNLFKKI